MKGREQYPGEGLPRQEGMTLTAEFGSIVVPLVIMTRKTRIPGSHLPPMGSMAACTDRFGVFSFPVFSSESVVAGLAIDHRQKFRL